MVTIRIPCAASNMNQFVIHLMFMLEFSIMRFHRIGASPRNDNSAVHMNSKQNKNVDEIVGSFQEYDISTAALYCF